MSRAGKSFELGGIIVPLTAALGLSQSIAMVGGRASLRFANGASLRQQAWRRMSVVLSGDGWVPLGLDGLDFEATMTFKAGVPHALRTNNGVVTLPAARRTDTGYLPFARAHLPGGSDVATPVSLVGNVATCTTVTGAISYTVSYYPQLTVWADPPEQQFDRANASANWSLNLEEA